MKPIVAVVQARLSSSRLPNKMLLDLAGKPVVARTLERVQAIPEVDTVILATSTSDEDRQLQDLANKLGVQGYAGSLDDVLDRVYCAAKQASAATIMRITGDCPLLDPAVCQEILNVFKLGDADYVSNVRPPTYPDGLDSEVFSFKALETAWQEATLSSDREHVTQFLWTNPLRFRLANVEHEIDLSALRWTVDEPDDLEFVRQVYYSLARNGHSGFSYLDVLDVIKKDKLLDSSISFYRNEGQTRSMQEDGLDYAKSMERFER